MPQELGLRAKAGKEKWRKREVGEGVLRLIGGCGCVEEAPVVLELNEDWVRGDLMVIDFYPL